MWFRSLYFLFFFLKHVITTKTATRITKMLCQIFIKKIESAETIKQQPNKIDCCFIILRITDAKKSLIQA